MKSFQQELKLYKTAYGELQNSFKNNLNVIKQLQQQNNELQKHLQQIGEKYETEMERSLVNQMQKHQKDLQQQENEFGREIDLVKKEYQNFIESLKCNLQQKNQDLITSVTKRHKNQMENMKISLLKQLQIKQMNIKKFQNRIKTLEDLNSTTQTKLNDSILKFIALQSQLGLLIKQKKQNQLIHQNYQQQIQTLKNSSSSWQEILKNRIKQLQDQKSVLEQEMTEIRYGHKQKIRKVKEEYNKKITQIEEANSNRLNEIMRQTKQIKFKYEGIKQQNLEMKSQVQMAKRQLSALKKENQEQKSKYNSVKDSLLTVKQKQFQIKGLNQQKRRLENELKNSGQEKNGLKEENEKINYQRQNAQKALQRLKVQLINKTRQNEQIRKELQKIKYKNQINNYNPQNLQNLHNQNTASKGLTRYDKKDAIKGQVDYSQCFTQDMGPVDQNFFMLQNSGAHLRSPQKFNNVNQNYAQQQNFVGNEDLSAMNLKNNNQKQGMLMKRIGQIQNENEDYKLLVKNLKQEMERTSHLIEQKLLLKDRQIRLGKDENMMLRQKLNDKQAQLMTINQNVRFYKQQNEKLKLKEIQLSEVTAIKLENVKLGKESETKTIQIQNLQQEIKDLMNERSLLQQIADQLRSQLNELKQLITQYQAQNYSHYNKSHLPNQNSKNYHHKKASKSSNYEKSSQFAINRNPSNLIGDQGYLSNLSNNYSQNNKQQNTKPQEEQNSNKNSKQNQHLFLKKENNNFLNDLPQNTKDLRRASKKSPENNRQKSSHYNIGEQKKVVKRKLHQLIKQKNALQTQGGIIMGRKAMLERRIDQQRAEHTGTKSQKQIYQKLQKKSKSKSRQKGNLKFKDYKIGLNQKQFLRANRDIDIDQSQMNQKQNNREHYESIKSNENKEQSSQFYQKNGQSRFNQEYESKTINNNSIEQRQNVQNVSLKRSQLLKKIRKQMLMNESELQNVSMTYWEQS